MGANGRDLADPGAGDPETTSHLGLALDPAHLDLLVVVQEAILRGETVLGPVYRCEASTATVNPRRGDARHTSEHRR
jgi:hypothetical protein